MHKYYLPASYFSSSSLSPQPPPPLSSSLPVYVKPLFAVMLVALFFGTMRLFWLSSSSSSSSGENVMGASMTSDAHGADASSKRLPFVSKISPAGVMFIVVGVIVTKLAERMTRSTYREYTREEVAKHNNAESCWLVVNDEVFDVTHFVPKHPPGSMLILNQAGKDATRFYRFHLDSTKHFWKQNKIGWISGSAATDREKV